MHTAHLGKIADQAIQLGSTLAQSGRLGRKNIHVFFDIHFVFRHVFFDPGLALEELEMHATSFKVKEVAQRLIPTPSPACGRGRPWRNYLNLGGTSP
ncbi:MAG TPA: hypothetical protein VJ577_06875 [Burkholderiaceae bacterium]|nr:hypothetical protein [Burkholderiaceae bacterium]